MIDCKIGQLFRFTQDFEFDTAFGEKRTIPRGTRAIVGADGFAHYLDGTIQPLGDAVKVEGYDTDGMTEWIYKFVQRVLDNDMLEDYEVSDDDVKEQIREALSELFGY